MIRAWADSNPHGPLNKRNEHGFWITQVGSRYYAGETLSGGANYISGVFANRPTNANIFFHVHPFPIGRGYPEIGRWDAGLMGRNPGIYYITFGYTAQGLGFREFDLRRGR
jgi:hypothetical protein